MKPKLLAIAIATALPPGAWALDFSLGAANTAKADTEQWQCERCTPTSGLSGYASLGAGYADVSERHFANDSGVDDDGAVVRGDARLTNWSGDDTRYRLLADQLGYEVAKLALEMERAGDKAASLLWQQFGHWGIEGRSPYSGASDNDFRLPANWQTGPTTAQMPGLDQALSSANTKIRRNRLGIGLEKYFDTIRTYLDFQHDDREGRKEGAGTILTNAVNLTERVDDKTSNLAAGLSVAGGPWQVAFGAKYSEYRNDKDALRWQNPFTPAFGDATDGQQAVAPDNEAYQYHGQATWASGAHLVSGQVVWNRHTQDDNLLPATINGDSPALPTSEGDLKLDVLDASLRYRLRLSSALTAQLELDHEDRDYRSPLRSYPYVITDSLDGGTLVPVNYDTQYQRFGALVQYRFSRSLRGDLGYAFTHREWEEQAANETDEHHLWGKLRMNQWQALSLWFEIGYQDRELDTYRQGPDDNNDPRLRPYHQADRDNTYGKAVAQYQFDLPLSLQFTLEGNKADYDIPLGLDEVERVGGDLSLNYQAETFSAYAFGNYYNIQTTQTGSPESAGNWAGEQDDHATTFGVGTQLPEIWSERLTLGLDMVYAEGEGDTTVRQGLSNDYDDYESTRFTVDLYGRYHLSEASSLQLDLLYQDYDDSDYLNQGLSPSSINNVLILGDLTRDYSDYLMSVSYRHDF